MKTLKNLAELPWLAMKSAEVEKAEWYFPSVSANATLHVQFWKNNARPVAILQIAHGMMEHIDRYDDFARYAAEFGLLVVGEDHLGHGLTAADESQLGYFAIEDGHELIVRDMAELTRKVKEIYPELPVFLLGHSMGAMLAELYCTRYPDLLSGLILSGLPEKNGLAPFCRKLVVGHIYRYGLFSRDCFINGMMNKLYNRKFRPGRTDYDWFSNLDEAIDSRLKDPLCCFPFTAAGLRDLMQLNISVNTPRWFDSVPRFLPIQIFAGAEDPVGGFGKGVRKIEKQLLKRHRDVTVKLYPGARHIILEDICAEEAKADLVSAVFRHIKKAN